MAVFKLQTIPEGAKAFQTQKTTYYVENPSIERLAVWQKFDIWFAFGVMPDQIVQQDEIILKLMNKGQYIEAGNIILNRRSAFHNLDYNRIPEIEICTLFINGEEEDRRRYDEKVMEAKKADWIEAGIDPQFFFQYAKIFAGRYAKDLQTSSPDILEKTIIP